MRVVTGPLLACYAAALLATSCTTQIDGTAALPASEIRSAPMSPGTTAIDADQLLLGLPAMRAITGAGDDLNIIPTMDTNYPVDIDELVETAPPECSFIYAETDVFGSEYEQFHKTTYQNPPGGGLISEAVAVYADPEVARETFATLGSRIFSCSSTEFGLTFVGQPSDGENTLSTRPAGPCGRDYQVKGRVLIEVTFCAFPGSVPDIAMTNIATKVPAS